MRSPALAAALATALLSGCAATPSAPPPPLLSPYPASGYGYGYTEEQISADLLRVNYYGPLRPLDFAAAPRGTQLDRAAGEAARRPGEPRANPEVSRGRRTATGRALRKRLAPAILAGLGARTPGRRRS